MLGSPCCIKEGSLTLVGCCSPVYTCRLHSSGKCSQRWKLKVCTIQCSSAWFWAILKQFLGVAWVLAWALASRLGCCPSCVVQQHGYRLVGGGCCYRESFLTSSRPGEEKLHFASHMVLSCYKRFRLNRNFTFKMQNLASGMIWL